jgi:hypothetical protein
MPQRLLFLFRLLPSALLCVMFSPWLALAAEPPATKTNETKSPASKTSGPTIEDVLAGLPAAVNLPKIETPPAKPVALGKAPVPATALVAVAFHGSEIGTKARPRSFSLIPQGEEFTTRVWQIQLSPAKAKEEPLVVAKLSIENQQLMFQWSAAAAEDPQAALLVNCVFTISAGRTQKKIAFRKPIKGAPLPIQLTKETSVKWEIPAAPEVARIKIDLSTPAKTPRHRFIGKASLQPNGEGTWLEFTEKDIAGMVRVQIECKMRAQLELTATPFLVFQEKKTELTSASIKRLETQLQQHAKTLEQQIALAAQFTKGREKDAKATAAKTALEKQLSQLDATRTKLKNLSQFIEKTPELPPLQLRAYVETESVLVDLMSSGAK